MAKIARRRSSYIALIKSIDLRSSETGTSQTYRGTYALDFSRPWQLRPPSGSLLFGRELPSVGGDTMLANMYSIFFRNEPFKRLGYAVNKPKAPSFLGNKS
ncbi:MAG TPA: hypothetical protein DD666_15100 [Advenella kashmirensis]|uniref:Uncharacterized protein n=1 Tax=Advenella kashmirensis TaxID=310575 RepID=A0A356LII5_9BURK|nr:hypothetical protein [Advenella kashmirensis]